MNAQNFFDFYSQHLSGLNPDKDEQKVRCIFHEDQKPSLSVNLARGFWQCHAGCGGGGIKAFKKKLGISTDGAARVIVAEYNYNDENDNIVFQTVRYQPKDFRQRRPDGMGGWIYNLKGARRVLYRLPELLKSAGEVIVVEGEKDVEILCRKNFIATTCPMGAGKWRNEYNEFLRGRDVVIFPDNDAPGRKHADEVACSLWGVAASIKIVFMPGLDEHGDVSDFFSRGHDESELRELIERAPILSARPALSDGSAATDEKKSLAAVEFHLTDLGNAERLIAKYGPDLRYCEAWEKWFAWDGAAWQSGALAIVANKAKDTVRDLYNRAAAIGDDSERARFVKHALASENASKIGAMIALARRDLNIQIKPESLDVDPLLLSVLNGTVDLRTGNLRPHRREDLLTKMAPVQYDESAKCPTFTRFVFQIMAGNKELIEFLRRALGSALTGLTSDQCLFFLYGVGANGKSTLIEIILFVLGAYAMQATPEFLMSKFGERHPTELCDLFGKRFVATVEIAEGKRLAEVLVKQLTGGDRIRARRMHEDFWEFNPTHKIFLAANHKPVIGGTDYAIWRRIQLIPFSVVFRKPENPPDPDLLSKLKSEASGILNWLIQGCIDWQYGELQPPFEVLKATEDYKSEMDVIAAFLEERCVKRDDAKIKFSSLFDSYAEWCSANGENAENPRAFGRRLTERGFRSEKPGGVAYRLGVGLLGANHDK